MSGDISINYEKNKTKNKLYVDVCTLAALDPCGADSQTLINIKDFNCEIIIETTDIKDVPNCIISLYKDTWCLLQSRDRNINEQAVINSLDSFLFLH